MPVRSPLFCVDFLHDLDFQITVNQHLLKPGILCLQRLEAFDLVGIELAELFASNVDRRVTHAMSLGHQRHTVLIRLTQYPNNLIVTESSLLHSRLSLQKRPFSKASIGSKLPSQVKNSN